MFMESPERYTDFFVRIYANRGAAERLLCCHWKFDLLLVVRVGHRPALIAFDICDNLRTPLMLALPAVEPCIPMGL
jgi:hypothetical protein